MKIDDTDPTVCIVTLEDPNSYGAFKAGIDDHRQWNRAEETWELAKFVQDNRKYHQLVVKAGETYTRIK